MVDARRLVDGLVRCYNDERLHTAIGYVTPNDNLEGREALIFADGKRKSAEARQRRSLAAQQAKPRLSVIDSQSAKWRQYQAEFSVLSGKSTCLLSAEPIPMGASSCMI
jgi:hypothetical protein